MKKYFYSHLVDFDALIVKLDVLDLSEEERKMLLEIAHDTIHHKVMDLVLSELSEEDQQKFLHHLLHENHDEIWMHLNSKVENIEDKIKACAKEIQEELHKDIEDTKDF